jgi:hypothetical protein
MGVQAAASLSNPHLGGLPPAYGMTLQDSYTGTNDGASDGDPTYTRERFLYLGINGFSDCSDLTTFHIPGSDSDPTPRPINNNIFSGPAALPQGIAVGDRTIDVNVNDKLGNTRKWTSTLTYDPVNTDTTGTQTNTLGLPVLASGGSFTADNDASIIRTLTFSNVSVTDNLYGQRESLPAGRQFWGVWIANATSAVGASSPTLNWYPVRVPVPNSSFTVEWNLFSGLGFTTDLRNRSGNYFVYVRFLDGAGNPTEGFLEAQVNLAQGYAVPTVQMPVMIK